MKNKLMLLGLFLSCSVLLFGCSPSGTQSETFEVVETVETARPAVVTADLELVEVADGDTIMYLDVTAAEASSFDKTPDWAPEPEPMATVDGDMLTRWSSDYIEGIQWISFDLGKESVINEIVIKWERAHAVDYQILVSNDGQNWAEAYHETDGQGGTMTSVFPAVKCRYVKIVGLKRVNEDWGISIWEVEIYGPQSQNPGATTTKDEYLAKGDDTEKVEEAKNLLEKISADVVPLSENSFQKGVVYTSWMTDELAMPASDFTLAYLKGIGFDTISIMVPAYQEDLDSTVIFTNDEKDGGDTPTLEALKHSVETCHKIGLRVMIKPHVDPRTDEARINIMPSEAWFDSYEEFIVKYAKFSEENNVEMFSIGTELEATTFSAWAARWDQVIDRIKEVYSGTLTYSANWTEYKEVPFWSRMDYIGLDAYFPLSGENNPTVEDLTSAWDRIADEIDAWLKEKGLTDKGVILTEIGYPSADGAAQQPWVAISSVEDQQEQADCLEATFAALSKRAWFKGYYIWQYFPQDRWSPLGFTVKGKKSEEVLKKWIKKGTSSQELKPLGTQEVAAEIVE